VRIAERILAIILLLLTVSCDRMTKHLAVTHLADQPAQSYLGDTLRLEYAENTGAFLSLGSHLSEPLRFGLLRLGVGLALLAIFLVALKRHWHGLALAGATLLFAGGISNLFDRVLRGAVVDFASVGIGVLRTGIFNVADVAILLGGIMMVIGRGANDREKED
jgi:signal peptidase II